MDALVLIAFGAIAFLLFNTAAVVFGTDSRDPMPDDHQRRFEGI